MANGAPSRRPGALRPVGGGKTQAEPPAGFDADARTQEREAKPVTIGGRVFKRVRKDWVVSRAMRAVMRLQEKSVSKSSRLQRRIAELEAEQVEAASAGNDEKEAELEETIDDLVAAADEATEVAEVCTYRLLALLLAPAEPAEGEQALEGFGPANVEEPDYEPAVAFLQPELDVEDAAALAQELTGSSESDPPATPSTESGST